MSLTTLYGQITSRGFVFIEQDSHACETYYFPFFVIQNPTTYNCTAIRRLRCMRYQNRSSDNFPITVLRFLYFLHLLKLTYPSFPLSSIVLSESQISYSSSLCCHGLCHHKFCNGDFFFCFFLFFFFFSFLFFFFFCYIRGKLGIRHQPIRGLPPSNLIH